MSESVVCPYTVIANVKRAYESSMHRLITENGTANAGRWVVVQDTPAVARAGDRGMTKQSPEVERTDEWHSPRPGKVI